jgi:hypothetical protein
MEREYQYAERVIRRNLRTRNPEMTAGPKNYFVRVTRKSNVKITTGIMSSMV